MTEHEQLVENLSRLKFLSQFYPVHEDEVFKMFLDVLSKSIPKVLSEEEIAEMNRDYKERGGEYPLKWFPQLSKLQKLITNFVEEDTIITND
jgi:predicted transcriptional regulator